MQSQLSIILVAIILINTICILLQRSREVIRSALQQQVMSQGERLPARSAELPGAPRHRVPPPLHAPILAALLVAFKVEIYSISATKT